MAKMVWGMPFERGFDGPLDIDSVYETYADLQARLGNVTNYAGMIVSCVETDKAYILNSTKTSWITIGSGNGLTIVDDYTALPTTATEDTICYVKNEYTDTTATPNVTYASGFYFWNNSDTAPTWKLISSTSGIATYTDLGVVKVKQDGGIEIETDGEVHLEDYNKVDNGDGTVTITNGVNSYTKDTVTGDITGINVGGITVESSTTSETDGNGNIVETKKETIGGKEIATTIVTSGATNDVISKEIVESINGVVTSTTTTTMTNGTDSNGNSVNTETTTITTPNGTHINTKTETTDSATGNTTTVEENKSSGNDGITKIETTTTEKDNTGTMTSQTTEASYDVDQDLFASRDDVDNSYSSIYDDLGW